MLRVGIDVGGTNTDAALLRGDEVLAVTKQTTTADVTSGIVASLAELSSQHQFEPGALAAIMIGTTHFTNAVLQARALSRVGVIRLCLPETAAVPPMLEWPSLLSEAVAADVHLCHGGNEFDGRTISAIRPEEIAHAIGSFARKGIASVAVTSVFSPLSADHELRVAQQVQAAMPDAHISLSHTLGRIGLLERENATIINACLRPLAIKVCDAFIAALTAAGIDAPLYVSQNDGTLMDVEFCRNYPVATFASGPTNSMRGAAFLSGVSDCVVVDIGGTTTDVGVLVRGFPRQAGTAVDLGGVRSNFRMPDVFSIALGGGSLIRPGDESVSVGPSSVGFELTSRALTFGGAELTASDLAVAGGRAAFGRPELLAGVPADVIERGLRAIDESVSDAVDRVRTSAEPLPVVVVGGGSVLLGDGLPGSGELIRPRHYGVANAVGAAIAKIGAEVDRIFAVDGQTRSRVLGQAKSEAVSKAAAAGARAGSIEIYEVEEIPLTYLPGNAVRIRVKAVGDLEMGSHA
ncbi:MAG TPA: hydantoinase/oxoprolinase family protein [Streptosporangiaceae bacterium]|jgi:N-methylhydantoinase A/oxoprolinase/acetone carboxylase beta subunit